MIRKAILILVAYHPSLGEVRRLMDCLSRLSDEIGYAVVANDYKPGEPIDLLSEEADEFLVNSDNPGYGRAVNQAVRRFQEKSCLPTYVVAANTDLEWKEGCFENLLSWMEVHPLVVLAVPQLLDENGEVQKLCKQNPTVLGLLSRRFVPERIKPGWLHRYDDWYAMADRDYNEIFDVPYLSGCCMLIASDAFCRVGGFDEQFFLYLEDADLTRQVARLGRTVHLPVVSVVHHWGRGSHRSKRLTLVNLHSAWIYFRKWGLAWC
jgi:GT2 family glycosyltransferase